jgi:hypothetical protein
LDYIIEEGALENIRPGGDDEPDDWEDLVRVVGPLAIRDNRQEMIRQNNERAIEPAVEDVEMLRQLPRNRLDLDDRRRMNEGTIVDVGPKREIEYYVEEPDEPPPVINRETNRTYKFRDEDGILDPEAQEVINHIKGCTEGGCNTPNVTVQNALFKLAKASLLGTMVEDNKKRERKREKLVRLAKGYEAKRLSLFEKLQELKNSRPEVEAGRKEALRRIDAALLNISSREFALIPSYRDLVKRADISLLTIDQRNIDVENRIRSLSEEYQKVMEQIADLDRTSPKVIDTALALSMVHASRKAVPSPYDISILTDDDVKFTKKNWPKIKEAMDMYIGRYATKKSDVSNIVMTASTKLTKSDFKTPIRNGEVEVLYYIEKHIEHFDNPTSTLEDAILGNSSTASITSDMLYKGTKIPERDSKLVQEMEELNNVAYAGYDPTSWMRCFGLPISGLAKQIVREWNYGAGRQQVTLDIYDLIKSFDVDDRRDGGLIYSVPLTFDDRSPTGYSNIQEGNDVTDDVFNTEDDEDIMDEVFE